MVVGVVVVVLVSVLVSVLVGVLVGVVGCVALLWRRCVFSSFKY